MTVRMAESLAKHGRVASPPARQVAARCLTSHQTHVQRAWTRPATDRIGMRPRMLDGLLMPRRASARTRGGPSASAVDDGQLPRRLVQDDRPRRATHDDVLDPRSVLALDVDARLDAERHALGQRFRVARD